MIKARDFLGIFLMVILLYRVGCKKRPERADVCIIIDANGKYGPTLDDAINGIGVLIDRISISSSTTRLALITIGSKVVLQFKLDSCTNRECIKAKLKKIRHKQYNLFSHPSFSKTRTALQLASKLLRNDGRHDSKWYIVWIRGKWPSRTMMAYLRDGLAVENVILVSSKIHRYKSGRISVKLGFLFHKKHSHSLKSKLLTKGSYTRCNKPGKVYDECNRRCYCKHGRMVDCERVRKEFTEMSINERRRYIKAFKKLASDSRYKNRYEKFIKIHVNYFFKGIHTQNYFLPWHRWYMLTFENMIREIDCRITLPYWDWAFWSNVSWKENIHIWNKNDYGLGGDGDPKRGYCVQDGPFREGSFKTPEFDNKGKVLEAMAYAMDKPKVKANATVSKSGCLRRSFNGKPIGVPMIKKILHHPAGSFAVFEKLVRISLHNSMHNEIGGHMCSSFASVAPEFYLHHTFLDKLWFTWQQRSKACLKARFSNSHKKMSKFACQHSQSEMIDSRKLPGHIRVVYTDYYYHRRVPGKHGQTIVSLRQRTKSGGDATGSGPMLLDSQPSVEKLNNGEERSSADDNSLEDATDNEDLQNEETTESIQDELSDNGGSNVYTYDDEGESNHKDFPENDRYVGNFNHDTGPDDSTIQDQDYSDDEDSTENEHEIVYEPRNLQNFDDSTVAERERFVDDSVNERENDNYEIVNENQPEYSTDDEQRNSGSVESDDFDEQHFDEIQKDITDANQVKYGRTKIDFLAAKDFAEDKSYAYNDKQENKNCLVKRKKVGSKPTYFLPPYKKICYKKYIYKMLA